MLTPHVLDVLRAMSEIVKLSVRRSGSAKMAVVHTVGTVMDVVENRLMRSDVRVPAHQRPACVAASGALKQAAMTALTSAVCDPVAEAHTAKVLARVFMLLERYRRGLEQAGTADDDEDDAAVEADAAS